MFITMFLKFDIWFYLSQRLDKNVFFLILMIGTLFNQRELQISWEQFLQRSQCKPESQYNQKYSSADLE